MVDSLSRKESASLVNSTDGPLIPLSSGRVCPCVVFDAGGATMLSITLGNAGEQGHGCLNMSLHLGRSREVQAVYPICIKLMKLYHEETA